MISPGVLSNNAWIGTRKLENTQKMDKLIHLIVDEESNQELIKLLQERLEHEPRVRILSLRSFNEQYESLITNGKLPDAITNTIIAEVATWPQEDIAITCGFLKSPSQIKWAREHGLLHKGCSILFLNSSAATRTRLLYTDAKRYIINGDSRQEKMSLVVDEIMAHVRAKQTEKMPQHEFEKVPVDNDTEETVVYNRELVLA